MPTIPFEILFSIIITALVSIAAFFVKRAFDRMDKKAELDQVNLQRRREIYERLDVLFSELERHVSHGEDFIFKDKWVEEISRLAESEEEWMSGLAQAIRGFAWRVEKYSFSHDQHDSCKYCVDEIFEDAALIRFEMARLCEFDRNTLEKLANCNVHDAMYEHCQDGSLDSILKVWESDDFSDKIKSTLTSTAIRPSKCVKK